MRKRFQQVAVPQFVFDELLNYYATQRTQGPAAGYLGKGENGRYSITEVSEEFWSNWQKYLSSVLAFAESFERFPAYPVLDVNEIDKLLSTFPPTALGAIFAGNEVSTINSVLVCDDFALSNVARSLGTGAVNTQAVLQELRLSSVISDAEYSMLIEQLVLMNYRFVRMGHEDILRRIEESGYVTTLGIRKMIRTLEGPDCYLARSFLNFRHIPLFMPYVGGRRIAFVSM